MDDYEFGEPPEELHEFEIDVREVVLANLDFVLDGIARAHSEEVRRFQPPHNGSDQQSFVDWIASKHDGLRKAAINLALVGLVTRFHHWLASLANDLRADNEKTFDKSVVQELHFLNQKLTNSSIQPSDFTKWVDARDSIIHADSKASWTHDKKQRSLDPQFVGGGELIFSQADLEKAFQQMLSAIAWYMDHVDQWVVTNKGPQITFGGKPRQC